jgi:hypothetical protein
MAALLKGHASTVDLLLLAGASVSAKNKNGDTAIRSSAESCPPAPTASVFISVLVAKHTIASSHLVCSIGISSAFPGLPALLSKLSPSDSQLLLQRNSKRVTPLHAACSLSSPLASVVVPQVRRNNPLPCHASNPARHTLCMSSPLAPRVPAAPLPCPKPTPTAPPRCTSRHTAATPMPSACSSPAQISTACRTYRRLPRQGAGARCGSQQPRGIPPLSKLFSRQALQPSPTVGFSSSK